MNCRFDDILTFISVVEAGSVTSAAARLNVSKSVINKRISDLEAALRVELFQRSTGNVKPTEVALSCYERIVPLIRGITEVTERISQRNEYLSRVFLYVVPTDEELMIARHGVALLSRRGPRKNWRLETCKPYRSNDRSR
jgi:DNA-binding transcriptional LysR family regulator